MARTSDRQQPAARSRTGKQWPKKRHDYSGARVQDRPAKENDSLDPVTPDEQEILSSSGDDEDDDGATDTKSGAYDLLLQSLRGKGSRGEHPHKKRKIDTSNGRSGEEPNGRQSPESLDIDDHQLQDPLEEPDVPEDAAEDAAADADDPSADDTSDEEDGASTVDPFQTHFAHPNEEMLSRCLAAISQSSWQTRTYESNRTGRATLMVPTGLPDSQEIAGLQYDSPASLKLKHRLTESAAALFPAFDPLESVIAPHIFNYRDVSFCGRTLENAHRLRNLTCLHALNHILKTRDRVVKNNGRKIKHQGSDELELRDQGFTRPKVLFILPTRQACVRVVDVIVQLCRPEQQENKKRFQDSFSQHDGDVLANKPDDFRDLFGGNDDDMFRIGLKFTRKTIKFFAPFYNSDIILASPLGLYMAMGAEDVKKRDHDFLSSIEIVVVDHADALLMQNWDNVEYIFDHLNLQPKDAHGCDFSRVRSWSLDGHAPYLRQTLLLSSFNTPDLNSIFMNRMKNVAGKVRFMPKYDGAIMNLGIRVKHTFSRFSSASPAADPDVRFRYFSTAVVPKLRAKGTLIFIPSYFDFVRVRNFLSTSTSTQNISFGAISEYTSVREVSRARSHFLSGRHSVLLYSERAHHFRRYRLKGVTNVVLYGLPDNALFYRELVEESLGASVQAGKLDVAEAVISTLFSKWDALKLERIVGTERVASMLKEGSGDRFEFI